MDISFSCNKCSQHIVIDEAGVGQLVDCPKCGTPLEVPYKSQPTIKPATPAPQPVPNRSTISKESESKWENISFDCYKCGQNILVDATGAGKTPHCPKCGTKLVVPDKSKPSKIAMTCKWCHKDITVDASLAGHLTHCPLCDDFIMPPEPATLSASKQSGSSAWTPSKVNTLAPPGGGPPETKSCPFCAETVKKAAVVCAHCGRDLAPKTNQGFNGGSSGRRDVALIAAGYICGMLALLVFPPGLGVAGTAIGIVNLTKQRTGHGIAQIVISVTCAIFGMMIGPSVAEGYRQALASSTFGVTKFSEALNTSSEEWLVLTSKRMNAGLPMNLDSYTRWDSTMPGPGNCLTYCYTLVKVSKSEIDPNKVNAIKQALLNACRESSDPDLKLFQQKRVTLRFMYKDKYGEVVTLVEVSPNDL